MSFTNIIDSFFFIISKTGKFRNPVLRQTLKGSKTTKAHQFIQVGGYPKFRRQREYIGSKCLSRVLPFSSSVLNKRVEKSKLRCRTTQIHLIKLEILPLSIFFEYLHVVQNTKTPITQIKVTRALVCKDQKQTFDFCIALSLNNQILVSVYTFTQINPLTHYNNIRIILGRKKQTKKFGTHANT